MFPMKFDYHFYKPGILLLFFVLIGCDTTSSEENDPIDPPPTTSLEPTLSSIQANIFNATCATSQCHDSNDPERDLDMSAGRSFEEMVNVASIDISDLLLVKPSDPDSSYLVWKIEGRQGIEGQRMPRGMNASPLSTTQINVIRQWISDGALDN